MRDIHSRDFVVPETRMFDEENNKFIYVPRTVLTLRHSLVSISEWEMKYKIPYMLTGRKWSEEETLYYMKCMTVGDIPDDNVYRAIPYNVQLEIREYINDPLTAARIKEMAGARKNNQDVTSDLIYAWMVMLQMPAQPYETWHLERLITLIKTVSAEQAPKKKMTTQEVYDRYMEINERNRAKFNSKG